LQQPERLFASRDWVIYFSLSSDCSAGELRFAMSDTQLGNKLKQVWF